jgi:hypothetical protein
MLIVIVLLSGAFSVAPVAGQEPGDVFNGTIQSLDSDHGKLTVKNALGRDVVLDVANPDLLRDLAPGDQVSIEMERPGLAKKVTKLSVPELSIPPPTGN